MMVLKRNFLLQLLGIVSVHASLCGCSIWENAEEYSICELKTIPIGSMYGIFTYIYHINQPNAGKYTVHGFYGIDMCDFSVVCKLLIKKNHMHLKPDKGGNSVQKLRVGEINVIVCDLLCHFFLVSNVQ